MGQYEKMLTGTQKKIRMHRPLPARGTDRERRNGNRSSQHSWTPQNGRPRHGNKKGISRKDNINRKVTKSPEIDRISKPKQRKRNKVSARSVRDSLEGESHHPRY